MADAQRRLRVVVGSDMQHQLAGAVVAHLESLGCVVVRSGAVDGPDTPWPDVAEQVARLVAQGAVDTGVLCCWTGTGVSIAANKVPGVRAALCADAETARGARRWNDANVLALSLANTDPGALQGILESWLGTTEVDASEAANVRRVTELEARYRRGPG
jgi:ribose 5-phosphate isomerase B